MASRYFTEMKERKVGGGAKPPPTGKRSNSSPAFTEKTASWPGLPGKAQSKDRSGGVKKIKYVKSDGI